MGEGRRHGGDGGETGLGGGPRVRKDDPRIECVGSVDELSSFLGLALAELARDIQNELKEDFMTDYDQSGAIGKRDRRQDEVGTPCCGTVDYDSKEDDTVTLRFRDSMEQVRVKRSELAARIREEIKNYKRV